jgi:hypothetical protein
LAAGDRRKRVYGDEAEMPSKDIRATERALSKGGGPVTSVRPCPEARLVEAGNRTGKDITKREIGKGARWLAPPDAMATGEHACPLRIWILAKIPFGSG